MKTEWNKKTVSAAIVYGIIFLTATVLFIAIPFPKRAASIVSFIFTLMSVVISLVISFYAFKDSKELSSKVYGFPIFRIGVIYTVLQLIVCFIICVVGAFVNVPVWIALVTSILLLAAAAIGVIAADNTRDVIENLDEDTRRSIKKISTLRVNMDGIADMCSDALSRKAVERLAEEFRYSDPVSSPETEEIEHRLSDGIDELRTLTDDPETLIQKAGELSNLLAERNRLCKMSKH